MKMAKGVTRRAGSQFYQWGIKVPKDLAALYPSPWAARSSQDTADLREANRLAAHLEAKWQDRFAADRRRLNPTTQTLTAELVQRLAAAWAAELLSDDAKARRNVAGIGSAYVLSGATFAHAPDRPTGTVETAMTSADLLPNPDHGRFDGYSNPQLAALQQQHMRTLSGWQDDRAKGHLAVAQRALDWHAQLEGIKIDWGSAEAPSHLAAFQCAMIECAETLVARSKGQVSDSERIGQIIAAPSLRLEHTAKPAQVAHTIFDALEAWKTAEVNRPPKTVSQYADAAKRFDALMPGRSLESLTDKDGLEATEKLKHWAHAEGLSQTTAKNRHVCISALLKVAVRKGWCAVDPMKGTGIKKEKSQREPWAPDDIPKLFDDPVFTAYQMPKDRKAGLDAAYWVPLLALYTGARITELCQLMTTDVSKEAGGLVIEIKADAEAGQSTKTESSHRAIPVHSELIRLGFADYWQAVSTDGPRRLFPALRTTDKNGAGNQLGSWFSDYKTAKGFDGKKVFHSFRHTLQHELGFAGVSPTIVDSLSGHAGQGEGRATYGSGMRRQADRLRPELERLKFPGLSLPRVFERPVWKPEWTPKAPRVARTTKT